MRQIMEAVTAMLFIVLLCITGMELINAQIETDCARQSRNSLVRVMEESDFDEEILATYVCELEKRGYEIELNFFQENGECILWSEGSKETLQEVTMATAKLSFYMKIPVIHSRVKHTLYATVG